jgi:hypothetical protein
MPVPTRPHFGLVRFYISAVWSLSGAMEHCAQRERLAISAQMDLHIGLVRPSRLVGQSLDGRTAHHARWVLLATPVATQLHFGLVRYCTSVARSLVGPEARFAVLAQPVESAATTIFGKLAPTVRKAVRSYCVHVKEMFN